jgi:hypothetical protein
VRARATVNVRTWHIEYSTTPDGSVELGLAWALQSTGEHEELGRLNFLAHTSLACAHRRKMTRS